MIKPFLKYPGNKTKLLNKIIPHIKGNKIIEPFCGTCVLSLNYNAESYYCNDINEDLINLYKTIKGDKFSFISNCKKYFNEANNSKENYEYLKNEFNKTDDIKLKSYLFIYLNRHCFNGLCRYNKKKEFNVSFGRYNKPYFPEDELINFISFCNKKINFTNLNYMEVLNKADENTTIYLDPPYSPLHQKTNFTTYNGNSFNFQNHIYLKDMVVRLVKENKCKVIISNHDTDETRDLYSDANLVERFSVRRNISCKIDDRKMVGELLAIYE